VPLRRRYWRLGAAGGWEEIALLRRQEMEDLFGAAQAERFGPLAKSWVSVRPPRPDAGAEQARNVAPVSRPGD
jgi:hypothetical protein